MQIELKGADGTVSYDPLKKYGFSEKIRRIVVPNDPSEEI